MMMMIRNIRYVNSLVINIMHIIIITIISMI